MVTYAQVASHPTLHRVRTEQRKTLVIFDEIHHGGDAKTWGEAIREAFGDAARRLALTGTPFRSDDSPIPFVTYASGADGVLRSQADHNYGYPEALARPLAGQRRRGARRPLGRAAAPGYAALAIATSRR
jgi:superfamily II DNA or RNA helicase